MAISTGAALVASTVGNALIQGYGQRRAADAQRDSSRAAIQEQQRQFDAMMERSQPFYEGSLQAYNSLLEMEGLGGGAPARPSIVSIPPRNIPTTPPHGYRQRPGQSSFMNRPSISNIYWMEP